MHFHTDYYAQDVNGCAGVSQQYEAHYSLRHGTSLGASQTGYTWHGTA